MKALIPILLSFILFHTVLMGQNSQEKWDSKPDAGSSGLIATHRGAKDWGENPKVFLIPIRQPIMEPAVYLVRRGVEKARELEADAIVIQMDTPGGGVTQMREIVSHLIDLDIPTYTLVEKDAFSAGAIIALSTDYIYMQPRSVIGDAMPIIMGQNGIQTLGEAEREKVESGMDAIVRGIAEAKGRDILLIRAMVRRELEYTLDDGRVISKEGKILTMTNKEAQQLFPDGTPFASEGTVENLEDMLKQIGLEEAEQIELLPILQAELTETIITFSPLILGIALLFMFIELQSPGLGWFGIIGIGALFIVFYGFYSAGLANSIDLILIAFGVILLFVELFILPGFGIAGITGLICLVSGLIQAMSVRYPGNPNKFEGFDNFGNIDTAITTTGLAIIFAFLGIVLLMRSMNETSIFGKRLILSHALGDSPMEDIPPRSALSSLVGNKGIAVTPLSPSGTVDLEGKEFDALSDGTFVESGTSVTVVNVRNGRIIVANTEDIQA